MAPYRFNPAARGLTSTYREGEVNRCPGCGRTQWLIGRTTAECAFCSTALPLESGTRGNSRRMLRGLGGGKISRMALA